MKRTIIVLFTMVMVLAGGLFTNVYAQKKYPTLEATAKVKAIYKKILRREADASGLDGYSGKLIRGETTPFDIIKTMALSDEYGNSFVSSKTPREAIKLMYVNFLGREPENDAAIQGKLKEFSSKGWKKMVEGFLNSDEYSNKFGKHLVPGE